MEIQKLDLTQEEINYIHAALDMAISTLEDRFEEEPGFIHPALKYKEIYRKIDLWESELPSCSYSLYAELLPKAVT